MKNIRFFLSENFSYLKVKISIYLNMHVFVMSLTNRIKPQRFCVKFVSDSPEINSTKVIAQYLCH